MKVNVTRKSIAQNYYCKSAGYCSLQTLFRGIEANFYTHGIYGWNFDAYTHGNKCVTTGYRNMIGDSIPYREKQRMNFLKNFGTKYSNKIQILCGGIVRRTPSNSKP